MTQIGLVHADLATFAASESKLTGNLRSIGKDGIIEWQSPYSKEPLKLLASKLQQVDFSTSPESDSSSPIQITLRNGDVLPVDQVTALEEAGLVTKTPIAGVLTIPRSALASAQFGVTKQNVIYSGFENIRDWTTGTGRPDNWNRQGNSLVSNGQSIAAHDCKLPRNFIIRFDLSWDNRSPNYTINFADSLASDTNKQDCYRFNFDGSGIRIARQVAGEARGRTLAQWPRRPSQFTNNSAKVEIRLDRDKRLMELFINGESEGLIIDPLENIPVPSGTGVGILCQTSTGTQTISQLVITELNDSRTRHLAEKRGDPSLDCLITTEDDRWSGELITIGATSAEPFMMFKTSFAKETWEIPQSEVSTLFFANNPFKGGPGGEPVFIIEFHGKGKLSTTNCLITGDQVEAVHPLLGSMQIQRSVIKSIRRISE